MYDESRHIDVMDLDIVIEENAVLVKRIAHHMMMRLPPSVQIDDLIQAGMIGLLEAANKFDDSKGASFSTYAGIRIRGSMLDEIRKGDWVPRSVHRNSRKVTEAIKNVENRIGRYAKDQEIADELGVDLTEYNSMLQDTSGSRLFSFDELVGADEVSSEKINSRFEEPEEGATKDNFNKQLASAIKDLPERERLVLSLYYEEELNLKEIGSILEVSESRVSQIHSQAAMRLGARLEEWRK